MKTVSIGYHRDDGDFAVLATLNNNDELIGANVFAQLAGHLRFLLSYELEGDLVLEIVERQDAPDYVTLDNATNEGT